MEMTFSIFCEGGGISQVVKNTVHPTKIRRIATVRTLEVVLMGEMIQMAKIQMRVHNHARLGMLFCLH